MEIFKKILDFFEKKIKDKQKKEKLSENKTIAEETEEEKDTSAGEQSFNEGSHGAIYLIKRNIVKAVFAGVVLLFIVAIWYVGDDKKAANENNGQEISQNVVDPKSMNKKNGDAIVDDYEHLIASENRKKEAEEAARKSRQTTPTPPATEQKNNNTVNTELNERIARLERSVPAIPSPSATPVQQAQTSPPPKTDEKENDIFGSAIAFGNFGVQTQTATGGNTENKPQENAAAADNGNGSPAYVTAAKTNPSPYTLSAGTVIPVRLLTGINFDTPGQIMAQILSDVYDYSGQNLLIKAGSRVLGTYTTGSGRIALTFSQLQTDDGTSWSIGESITAIDGAGYSGIQGKVHRHTGRKIAAGGFGSGIAALGSLAAGNASSTNNTYTAGQLAAQGALGNLINSTSQMISNAANINATISVSPGYEFNLYVTQDIVFSGEVK